MNKKWATLSGMLMDRKADIRTQVVILKQELGFKSVLALVDCQHPPKFPPDITSLPPQTQKNSPHHTHTDVYTPPSIPCLPRGVSAWPTFPSSAQTTQEQKKSWCLISSLEAQKLCQQEQAAKPKSVLKNCIFYAFQICQICKRVVN